MEGEREGGGGSAGFGLFIGWGTGAWMMGWFGEGRGLESCSWGAGDGDGMACCGACEADGLASCVGGAERREGNCCRDCSCCVVSRERLRSIGFVAAVECGGWRMGWQKRVGGGCRMECRVRMRRMG